MTRTIHKKTTAGVLDFGKDLKLNFSLRLTQTRNQQQLASTKTMTTLIP